MLPSDGLSPRWWSLLGAASFALYFFLLVYCEVRRPEAPGLAVDFTRGVITKVVQASPAARAGLRSGDAIVAIDGRPVRTRLAWQVVESNLAVGTPLRVTISREGAASDVDVRLGWLEMSRGAARDRLVLWAARGVQAVTLLLALFVALKRPDDASARVGAAFLASVGVFTVLPPLRFAAVWRSLPLPLEAVLWIPFLAWIAVGALWFAFCALFPRTTSWPRYVWAAILAPGVITAGWHAWHGALMMYAPDRAASLPDWSVALIATIAAYVLAGILLLVAKYRRLTDANERRRIRVLTLGAVAGVTGGLPMVLGRWTGGTASGADSLTGSPGPAIGMLLLLSFPIGFAYATLRHRMFDIRVMIRQGIRYTLARRLVLSLAPALALLIATDALLHHDQTLEALIRLHGLSYGILLAVIVAASIKREAWLDSLDRRFFREGYNAQKLLRQLIEDIRGASDFDGVARAAAVQIEATLHPRFVQILIRDKGGAGYRVFAAPPSGVAPLPPGPQSKVMGVLRVLSKPIEVGPANSSWLRHHLPPDERDLLRRSGICLLVPITPPASDAEAVLVLGDKRSEEPYSAEDHDLLGAIAHSLALVLERPTPQRPPESPTLEECPECGTCYDSGSGACTRDGRQLTAVAVSRSLGCRYRLERRLGQGGMGAVYAGIDLSLGREVAAKLIRHDAIQRPDAIDRFHREARLAAGLSHPNVVTVYDFGVQDGQLFLIMELVNGVTLRREMQELGRIPPARVRVLLRGLCSAIEVAHRQRLVHRDLKPENVMLTGTGRDFPKILDFGVAKLLRTDTTVPGTFESEMGMIAGTLQYMAPEQLRGEEPHPAWDLWALAVLTCEMLTGVLPFAAASATPFAVDSGGVSGATLLNLRAIPGNWPEFFAYTLALDPRGRPHDAPAFLEALERAAGGC